MGDYRSSRRMGAEALEDIVAVGKLKMVCWVGLLTSTTWACCSNTAQSMVSKWGP